MPSTPDANYMVNETYLTYEYAVLRYVPDVEREEFINVGLIMMCKRKKWVRIDVSVNVERISILFPGASVEVLREQLEGFVRVARGDVRNGGNIAALEAHERFRWLTAVRSACLQTSRPHTGLAKDLDKTFERLFKTLVEA